MSAISSSWLPDSVRVAADAPITANVRAIREWLARENELKVIRRYRANWDGYGADAPDRRLVDAAIYFLHEMRRRNDSFPPMRVALSPDGLVALEWVVSAQQLWRAEVRSPNEVEWMFAIPGQPTRFETEPVEPPHRDEACPPNRLAEEGAATSVFGR
jgi:hypothetical protein